MLSCDINVCTVPDHDEGMHYICELNLVTGTNVDKRVHNINPLHTAMHVAIYLLSYIP